MTCPFQQSPVQPVTLAVKPLHDPAEAQPPRPGSHFCASSRFVGFSSQHTSTPCGR